MEHFYKNIHGWFDFEDLYLEMVNKFPNNSHFVEIGTWKGKSAAYMAVEIINSEKNIKFDCIDVWEYIDLQSDIQQSEYTDNFYDVFLKNIEEVKHIINPIKSISWDASRFYEDKSLDFIFIDAAHDYDSVTKDLNAWYRKLKPNGIIAGHDYAAQLREAVDNFASINDIQISKYGASSWISLNK